MTLEGLVERVIATVPMADLAAARETFHARTGAFEANEPFYEERIRAFFDWLAIDHEDGALLRRFVAEHTRTDEERALAGRLATSMRSLWRVSDRDREGDPIVACMLGGARFVVRRDEGPASRLTAGDVLDGRLVAAGPIALLAPGPVFHPREAHDALERLLEDARAQGRSAESLLDPLLRMRMRFDRFTSMHARHVYRVDALDRMEILAAPWHR